MLNIKPSPTMVHVIILFIPHPGRMGLTKREILARHQARSKKSGRFVKAEEHTAPAPGMEASSSKVKLGPLLGGGGRSIRS